MLELSTIVSFVAITSFRRKARAVQESRISARQYVQAWYELHVPFSRRNTVTYAPNQLESLLRWTSSFNYGNEMLRYNVPGSFCIVVSYSIQKAAALAGRSD